MNEPGEPTGATAKPRMTVRRQLRRLGVLLGGIALVLLTIGGCMFNMPGKSHKGPLPPVTEQQSAAAQRLRETVVHLAETIGERHVGQPQRLHETAAWIEAQFVDAGYTVERQTYDVNDVACDNLIVEIKGSTRPNEIVILGAHYDSVPMSPGANDNASGIAAMLELARQFAARATTTPPARTLRFVAFVNEEPPYFQTEKMGSLVYARACKERGDEVVAMIALDGLGHYDDTPGSQHYPFPFSLLYPNTGNFIGFLGNAGSGSLVRQAIGTFREQMPFPSEGAAVPGMIEGVGWSDHWSFWQVGYPAIMVTDTLPFRYAHYHTGSDTPAQLDYEKMARVTQGLQAVLDDLTQ